MPARAACWLSSDIEWPLAALGTSSRPRLASLLCLPCALRLHHAPSWLSKRREGKHKPSPKDPGVGKFALWVRMDSEVERNGGSPPMSSRENCASLKIDQTRLLVRASSSKLISLGSSNEEGGTLEKAKNPARPLTNLSPQPSRRDLFLMRGSRQPQKTNITASKCPSHACVRHSTNQPQRLVFNSFSACGRSNSPCMSVVKGKRRRSGGAGESFKERRRKRVLRRTPLASALTGLDSSPSTPAGYQQFN